MAQLHPPTPTTVTPPAPVHGSPLQMPIIDIAIPPFIPDERITAALVRPLSRSIKAYGVLQPIVVRAVPPTWCVVSGSHAHRRAWYAVDASAFVAQTYRGQLDRWTYDSEREATAKAVAMNRPYHVVCGARRLVAAKLAGLPTVPVVVVEGVDSPEAWWKASNDVFDLLTVDAVDRASPG